MALRRCPPIAACGAAIGVGIGLMLAGGAAAAPQPAAPLAAAAAGKVDFVKQIKPVLEAHCMKCHGPEEPTSGYQINTKEMAFKAGDSDMPPITANNSSESHLYQLITAKKDKERMPQKAKALDPATVALIKKWIDEGAEWPDKVELSMPKEKPEAKPKK
jgi:mono/diheme cytochrome c family protein